MGPRSERSPHVPFEFSKSSPDSSQPLVPDDDLRQKAGPGVDRVPLALPKLVRAHSRRISDKFSGTGTPWEREGTDVPGRAAWTLGSI